jgi:hypothetical protein
MISPPHSTLINCTPHAVTVCSRLLPALSTQGGIRLVSAPRVYALVKFVLQLDAAANDVDMAELRTTTPQTFTGVTIPDDLRSYWDDAKTYTLLVSAVVAKYVVEQHLRQNVVAMDSSPAGVVRDASGQIVGTTGLEVYLPPPHAALHSSSTSAASKKRKQHAEQTPSKRTAAQDTV